MNMRPFTAFTPYAPCVRAHCPRQGVAGADDIDFKPQTATLRESLDAAAAAGIGELINVGVDRLAQAMVDFRGKPGKPRPPMQNLNTTELWGWVAGNISLVKDHPAVAAYCE